MRARLIAVDLMAERLEHARAFGADLLLDAAPPRRREERLERGARRRPAASAPTSSAAAPGTAASLIEALELVRPGGTVIEAGAFVDMGPVPINPNSQVCIKGVTILGVGGETLDQYQPALDDADPAPRPAAVRARDHAPRCRWRASATRSSWPRPARR